MKKYVFLIVIATIVLLTSCLPPRKPEKVAQRFVKSMENLDFKTAKKYATPESVQMINFAEAIVPEYAKILRKNTSVKINIVEKTIDAEKQEATVCLFVNNSLNLNINNDRDPEIIEESKTVVVVLKKINNKWLVNSEEDFYFN